MPISFETIPSNWKQPLYWVEVDSSKAGLPISNNRILLVGTMLTSGTHGQKDVPTPVGTQADADDLYGQGSELAAMFKACFANNFAHEVWGCGVTATGVAATGTVTVSTPPSSAGTFHLYVAGMHVPVSLGASETPTTVAAAIASAINANEDLPVTAAAASGVVTVTCKWAGVSGLGINLQYNYAGTIGGEQLPPGMVVVCSVMTGGTGVPTFTTAVTNLGETEFEYVAMSYTDDASLDVWEAEFGFSDTGRWGFIRQLFGHIFSAKLDTYGNLLTFGPTRNCAQLSVLGVEADSPTPVWEWAAAYTAKAARGLTNDPARPLQTLQLLGCNPTQPENRFSLPELNALSGNGIATQRAITPQPPMIARETTTYTKNRYGNSDDAYELVTTLATLAKLLRNQRQAITSKFPRHKLADDGTRFGAGQAIVTPKIVKAELVAQYRIDEFNGLVENAIEFKNHLIVERDPNDPNRLNVLYPPDLVNQLRVFAVLAQFRLQYNRGVDLEVA